MLVTMLKVSLQTYANNEIRLGLDDLPYPVRNHGDKTPQMEAEATAREAMLVEERYLCDNKFIKYTDSDGTVYRGNSLQGYEAYTADSSKLDIICELQDGARAVHTGSRYNYGKPVKPTAFTRGARHRLLEAGSVFDRRYSETHNGVFVTLTLPGSTDKAYDAVSRWSGFLANRTLQSLRDCGFVSFWFYCWELQKRGALHMHLFFAVPKSRQWDDCVPAIRNAWYSALSSIGETEGICLYQHANGDFCTASAFWQCDAQLVGKSPAAYISKYVGKEANAPGHASEKDRECYRYAPHRWWGMSREAKKATDAERFDVAIEAVTEEEANEIIAEMSEYIASMQSICTHEYIADIGDRRDGQLPIGRSFRRINWFRAEEFECIDFLVRKKFCQIVQRYSRHLVRYRYNSEQWCGQHICTV